MAAGGLPQTTVRDSFGYIASRNGHGSSQDVVIGVVGDGFGALLTYTTAIYLGFRPEQIGIFGENTNPVQTYQQFAWNLGQTVLRSESESHFTPADWPTFAQMDASQRRPAAPLDRPQVQPRRARDPERGGHRGA